MNEKKTKIKENVHCPLKIITKTSLNRRNANSCTPKSYNLKAHGKNNS